MSGPVRPLVGGSAPCKIRVDKSGQFEFQIKAADMPVKIKLCEDNQAHQATTSNFDTILVYSALTHPPSLINGQPSGVSDTGFSLVLPLGSYDVVMHLNHLPASQVAFIYEDWDGLNQLVRIPLLIQPSGYFSLKVI